MCIAVDSKGNKWFGTGEAEYQNLMVQIGQATQPIVVWLTIMLLPLQSMLMGINGLELLVVYQNLMALIGPNYTTADGMAHNYVLAIAIDAQGIIWVAPAAAIAYPPYAHLGVMEFDGKTSRYIIQSADYDEIESIAIDAHGNKWFVLIMEYSNLMALIGNTLIHPIVV